MARAQAKYEIRAEDKSAPGIRSAERRLDRFRNSLTGLARRFAVPFTAAAAAIAGLTLGLKNVVTGLDETAKSAKDFGISAAALQELKVTADLLGTDLNTLLRIQERFATSAKEAADGVKEYADVFKELGINAEAFAQLDFRSQLAAADIALAAQPQDRQTALRRELAGRRTGRLFTGDTRETLNVSRDLVNASLVNRLAAQSESTLDALRLLTEALQQRGFEQVVAPIADVATSQPVVNAIGILTDAIRLQDRRPRPVTFTDAQLDRLARAVRQPSRLQ